MKKIFRFILPLALSFLACACGEKEPVGGLLKGVFYANTVNKLAALVLKKDLAAMKKSMDVNEVGGTALVGISKPVIKAHGSSNAASFFAAIRQAVAFVNSGIIEEITAHIDDMKLKTE